jgi:hypothetical protein
MHGPSPHHNPLHAAARAMQDAAHTTKWRWLEHAAMGFVALSAAATTVIGGLQLRHLIRRELREEERERERERRVGAAPPPERPGQGAPAAMGDGERRWSSREERAQAASHARGR